KIGIAVACLLGVAGLMAWDQWRLKQQPEAPPTTTMAPAPLIAPLPTPVLQPVAPVGTTVICPEVAAPAVAEKKAETSAPAPIKPIEPPKVYTVVQGDTLYGISVKLFGTPRHYERIYEANKDRIKDPGTLQIGINLRMPEFPGTAKAAE